MNIQQLIMWLLITLVILIVLAGIIGVIVALRRRKLLPMNFLSANGQWERINYKPKEVDKMFEYDGEMYEYDTALCTRDNINRPVAHYYKGNPKQQQFDLSKPKPSVIIGTAEITGKDFKVLMLSKVLKDIFTDEEMQMWFIIVLCVIVVTGIVLGIMIKTHNPECQLSIESLDAINRLIRPNAPSIIPTN
jgi:cytochrome c-type biogenesis protein CcmH/NrfF